MMGDLSGISLPELYLRVGVLDRIIAESQGDPRVVEPKRQREILVAEIQRRNPPAQVIGVRPIAMIGKQPGVKE